MVKFEKVLYGVGRMKVIKTLLNSNLRFYEAQYVVFWAQLLNKY